MTPNTQKLMDHIYCDVEKEGGLVEEYHEAYITVYYPIAGWKAIMYWWNPEGFWEPWETSPFAFASEESAEEFGRAWAEEENIQFKPRSAK